MYTTQYWYMYMYMYAQQKVSTTYMYFGQKTGVHWATTGSRTQTKPDHKQTTGGYSKLFWCAMSYQLLPHLMEAHTVHNLYMFICTMEYYMYMYMYM